MSVVILHTPFDPARIPMRRPRFGPVGWVDYRDQPEQMAGFGRFMKKAAKGVTKIARAPVKLVAPKLAKKLERIDNKIIDNVDSVSTRVNKWAKKNAKWIIIAAAIVVTIYTMGAGAGFMAKFTAGLAKIKATVGAGGAWMKAKGASLLSAMTRLKGGAKMGELPPEEVAALAEANAATGENLVPSEILEKIAPGAAITPFATRIKPFTVDGPSFITRAMPVLETVTKLALKPRAPMPSIEPGLLPGAPEDFGPGSGGGGSAGESFGPSAPGGGLPGWVLPVGLGAAALVAVMIMKR